MVKNARSTRIAMVRVPSRPIDLPFCRRLQAEDKDRRRQAAADRAAAAEAARRGALTQEAEAADRALARMQVGRAGGAAGGAARWTSRWTNRWTSRLTSRFCPWSVGARSACSTFGRAGKGVWGR